MDGNSLLTLPLKQYLLLKKSKNKKGVGWLNFTVFSSSEIPWLSNFHPNFRSKPME